MSPGLPTISQTLGNGGFQITFRRSRRAAGVCRDITTYDALSQLPIAAEAARSAAKRERFCYTLA